MCYHELHAAAVLLPDEPGSVGLPVADGLGLVVLQGALHPLAARRVPQAEEPPAVNQIFFCNPDIFVAVCGCDLVLMSQVRVTVSPSLTSTAAVWLVTATRTSASAPDTAAASTSHHTIYPLTGNTVLSFTTTSCCV